MMRFYQDEISTLKATYRVTIHPEGCGLVSATVGRVIRPHRKRFGRVEFFTESMSMFACDYGYNLEKMALRAVEKYEERRGLEEKYYKMWEKGIDK